MTPKGWCPGALRPMPAGDGLLLQLAAQVERAIGGRCVGLLAAAGRRLGTSGRLGGFVGGGRRRVGVGVGGVGAAAWAPDSEEKAAFRGPDAGVRSSASVVSSESVGAGRRDRGGAPGASRASRVPGRPGCQSGKAARRAGSAAQCWRGT